jgi:hypothetical protein
MGKSKIISAIFCLLASCSAFADGKVEMKIADVELDKNGNFVECTLEDGRLLSATTALVIVGDEILSKNPVKAFMTETAEQIEYHRAGRFNITVSKQFSGREGYQSVKIEHLDGSKKIENLKCKERN